MSKGGDGDTMYSTSKIPWENVAGIQIVGVAMSAEGGAWSPLVGRMANPLRPYPCTVSGISFVSTRGAWQKNSFFLIGYFKRLSRIVGRVACLILVDNPCRAGRTNETYAWYRSRVWNSVRWRWIGFTYWLDSHKHFRD